MASSSSSSSSSKQQCRKFSLAEIRSATGNFNAAYLIGEGGFGKVYKAFIKKGPPIAAVKRLEKGSSQGRPEFDKEIETLTKIRHRNIVSLIGWCIEKGEMILVYEFIANKTLADHLHNGRSSLSWHERLSILIGAGRGLDYLHEGNPGSSIIHGDVKSSNILLNEGLAAKVSDFGLAKHLDVDNPNSHVWTRVKGSRGYLDPSFIVTGKLTRASDTYAFGVVVLEVLSGKRALDRSRDEEEWLLTDWASKRRAHEIVASNVSGYISEGSLKMCFELAKRCLHNEPKERPTMTQVLAQLQSAIEGRLQLQALNPPRVILSGSTEEDHNQVEFDELLEAIPEVALEHEQAVDELEYIQNANMLPETIPAIQQDALEHEQAVDTPPVIIPDELENEEQNVNMLPIAVHAIPLAYLHFITRKFTLDNWKANGSTGGSSVYYGRLLTGQDTAIKVLHKKLPHQEFLAQVSTVSRLKDFHVVQLLGYCVEGGQQIFVYEFAPRGSLDDILHGGRDMNGCFPDPALSWVQRIKIAVGAAEGLCYIHEKELAHHNIKSSNILLFDDDIAKITDLHLSTQCSCNASHPPCIRHHPPDFASRGDNQAGDVHSFGIVLLELLTGSEVSDHTKLMEVRVQEIVDFRLRGDYPPMAPEKIAAIAASCLEKEADSRPDMGAVLRDLLKALWETQAHYQQS